ncbi:alpha-ribazole phosphatase [Clostridium formicaceticum]|uniref:Alpha-ribazole phosphatase n=1 Tax=Clostridium formicaceticum TaxID=1497 RepID=A0AAC9RJN9_9CLOT|nr:alpha-ribazole phosphatase [Clostridium formicaceticum]AOY76460.1 alpha-ribazole phosphatase [Clostridium formicaceticum]ARE86859.1 Alpha-ribazole phosphatase [Clostridium formicaceticum]
MKHKNIYLIRHGDIGLQGRKCYIGTTNLPLSKQGVQQAQQLGLFFDEIQLEKVYCSDLDRCQNTAKIILKNKKEEVTRVIEKGLREIHMGRWENKSFDEIQKLYPEQFKKRGKDLVHFRPPEGESFWDLNLRVMKTFQEILHNMQGNILIVAHAGVNRIILCNLLNACLKNLFKIKQDYGCLNEIIVGKNHKLHIKKMNYVCHGGP